MKNKKLLYRVYLYSMLVIFETDSMSKAEIKTHPDCRLILMTKNEVRIEKIKKSLKEIGIKQPNEEFTLKVERNVEIEI